MNEIDELADTQVSAELQKMAAPTGLVGAGLGGIAGLAKAYIGESDSEMQEPGKKRLRRYLGHGLAGAGIGAGLEFAASGKGGGPGTGAAAGGTGGGAGTAVAGSGAAPAAPARSKNWVERSADALGDDPSTLDASLGKLLPINDAMREMNAPYAGLGAGLGGMAGVAAETMRNVAKPYVRAALRKTNFQGIPQVRQLTGMRDAVASGAVHDGDGLASLAVRKLTEKGIPDLERSPLTWFRKGDTGAEKFQKQWDTDVLPALRDQAGRSARDKEMSAFKEQETSSLATAQAQAAAVRQQWEKRQAELLAEARAGNASGGRSPSQRMLAAKVLEALLKGKDVSNFPTALRPRAQALADHLRSGPEGEALAGPGRLRANAAGRYSEAIRLAEETRAKAEKGLTEPSPDVPKKGGQGGRPGAKPKEKESRPRSRAEELYQSFIAASKGGEKPAGDGATAAKPRKGLSWRNGVLPGVGALSGALYGASVPKALPRDPGKFEDAR